MARGKHRKPGSRELKNFRRFAEGRNVWPRLSSMVVWLAVLLGGLIVNEAFDGVSVSVEIKP